MALTNMQGQVVIQIHRPYRCTGCCCPCYLQELEIQCPPGVKVATIKEEWSFCVPKFVIEDAQGQLLYRIQGDCCYCKCCVDVPFKITRADGQDAGQLLKHWGGCREIMGQVNDFSVHYAPGETPLNKAILLGATFLIDFMYFEIKN